MGLPAGSRATVSPARGRGEMPLKVWQEAQVLKPVSHRGFADLVFLGEKLNVYIAQSNLAVVTFLSLDILSQAQFMDQLTIYLGKHLIWLSTRQLFRGYPPVGTLIGKREPGEVLMSDLPVLISRGNGHVKPVYDYWAGFSPGPVALGRDPASHLRTIPQDRECWCGTGVRYGLCHRVKEQTLISSAR